MRKILFIFSFFVSITTAEAAYLDLSWDLGLERDLAGYRMYYGTSSGDYINFVDVGLTTTYRLDNLLEDVTFYIALTAYDSAGNESDFSEEVYGVGVMDDSPTAIFTYTDNGLTCDFDASDSYDPDGTIVRYEWRFGDGNKGTGERVNHTYAAGGIYTVVLTVTDDKGATDAGSQEVSVIEGVGNTMHVGDLDGTSINQGRTWAASVIIRVNDANHEPVAGALVRGVWRRGASGRISSVTDANGTCEVSIENIRKRQKRVVFRVVNVTHATLSYQPSDNYDPDGDSNGTRIRIFKH